jgi:hypothetical protein
MIDRLLTWARNGHVPVALADDLKEAANEIERLRHTLEKVTDWLDVVAKSGERPSAKDYQARAKDLRKALKS